MPPVRIDAKVWNDWRFKALAKSMSRELPWAIGAMAMVWRHCTENQTYSVSRSALETIVENPGFVDSMITCGLGEVLENGEIRVRGTGGRIEWLAVLRERARKGGEATRARFAGRTAHRTPSRMPSPLTLINTKTPEKSTDRAKVIHSSSDSKDRATEVERKAELLEMIAKRIAEREAGDPEALNRPEMAPGSPQDGREAPPGSQGAPPDPKTAPKGS